MSLLRSKDQISEFIPARTQMVILGTMASINAREINNKKPESAFYYHSPYNHFWRVIWYLFDGKGEFNLKTIQQKKNFLEQHGIAMMNLVSEIKVPKEYVHNPSDSVLFKAQKDRQLKFKTVSSQFKKILESKPVFFTCRYKKGIYDLLLGFQKKNKLGDDFYKKIKFLPSPTRCNPKKRSLAWKKEMSV